MRRAFLLFVWSAQAWAAPSPGPDFALDNFVVAPAGGDQEQAAVAFGAGKYLAVWHDGDGATDTWTIRGTRLAADGSALDMPPLVISTLGTNPNNAGVAFDGTRFLVVWQAPAPSNPGVWGAYVDPVTGAATARFAVAGSTAVRPSVGGGNGKSLVAWAGGDNLLHAQLYDNSGALIKSDFVIQPSPVPAGAADDSPTVVSGSAAAGFLVAWTRFSSGTPSVHGARVQPDGTVGTEFALNTTPGFVGEQQVASDGTQWFAMWVNSDDFLLHGRTIPYLSAPATNDFVVATPLVNPYAFPAVTNLSGGRLLAVWEDTDTVPSCALFGERLKADGTLDADDGSGSGVLIDSDPRAPPDILDSQRTPVASDGTHAVVVWTRKSRDVTGEDVMSVLVDPTVPSPSPLPSPAAHVIALGESFEITRAAAAGQDGFLVVWEDDRSTAASGTDIYGMRLHLDGTPNGGAFVICDAPGNQIMPSVASNGSDWLVAWADGRGADLDIYATRIGAGGGPLDANGFLVSKLGGPDANAQLQPLVTSTMGRWLVVWEDWRRSKGTSPLLPLPGIWSATVGTDGTVGTEAAVVDPGSDVTMTACSPALTWDGTHAFVAYEQPCGRLHGIYSPAPPLSDLAGNWIAADGTVDPSKVSLAVLAGAETQPAVVGTGAGVYLAWHDQTGGELIRAGLLADQGATVTAVTTLASGVGTREAPSVVSGNNETLLFTWVENGVQAVRAETLAGVESPFTITGNAVLQVAPVTRPPQLDGQRLVAERQATPPVALAVAPGGETVVIYNFVDAAGVPRLHGRELALLTQGTPCSDANGCESGICTGGVCCNTSCDGVCQACGMNGCIEKPGTDARCAGPSGLVTCKQLSTQCRAFDDVPLASCAAFGQCAEPGDPSLCTQFTDMDATSCTSTACGGAGTCMGGQCVCASEPMYSFPSRAVPPAAGCDVSGGGGGLWIVVLLLLALRRRALLLLLVGCTSAPPSLQLTLHMQDAVFAPAQVVRLVLSSTDGTAFHESAAATVKHGLTVANYDYDGNGSVDIVVEVAPDYPLDKVTHLQLEPDTLARMTQVTVRAEVFDGLGNRYARDQVAAVLTPGQVTHAPDLTPACVNNCPDATVQLAAAQAQIATLFPGRALTALASGNLSGAMPRHADVIAASAHFDAPGAPNAGQVMVLFGGGQSFAAQPDITLSGPVAGAQLGAALAVGDLDGDGKDELVIGAPGTANGAGAIFVVTGSSLPAVTYMGENAGDRLGTALALADVDGDGKLDVIAGAPGADTVYAFTPSAKKLKGPSLSGFGATLAAADGVIAVGAASEGAVYTTSDFTQTARLAGEGGGFGSALALLDFDGDGKLELAVGAPGEGAVFVVPAALGVTLDQSLARLRGDVSLGAAICRMRWPRGDALVAGAPSAHNGGGAAFVVRGQTLKAAPSLKLDAGGRPAAVALSGENLGESLGGLVLVDDFDGDGFADLLAAGPDNIIFYVEKGPLL